MTAAAAVIPGADAAAENKAAFSRREFCSRIKYGEFSAVKEKIISELNHENTLPAFGEHTEIQQHLLF